MAEVVHPGSGHDSSRPRLGPSARTPDPVGPPVFDEDLSFDRLPVCSLLGLRSSDEVRSGAWQCSL
eukprot:14084139-Alexandrium_andersonii.AAC.1